jgi:hypothetical protein
MAEVEDEKALQKRVYDLTRAVKLVELRALLEEHPEVDVDGCKDGRGGRALFFACLNGHTECAQLLIDHRADVHAKNNYGQSALHAAAFERYLSPVKLLVQHGADVNCQSDNCFTPLMRSAHMDHLTTAQYLLKQKADVHYRISKEGYSKNQDALHCAMRKYGTDREPGTAFAFLSCNTDAKNVKINTYVTVDVRDAHIQTYTEVHSFIDEHHGILSLVLSDHVQVDTRVGLGGNGIYQEPLERVLEYLGLSMSKDRVVNASIDGEGVRRALIPGQLLNANHWFNKYKNR